MPQEEEAPAWTYTHPEDHPDNNPPVTAVAVPIEEEKTRYEDAVNAVLQKTQPEPPPQAEENPKAAAASYDEMTVVELKELAKDRGVELHWDARKDEIVSALQKQDKAKK